MRFGWLLPLCLALFLAFWCTFFVPETSHYAYHRVRYVGLFLFMAALSGFGAWLRWGPLPFGTIVGAVIGMAAPMRVADTGLTAALPYILAGTVLGLAVDILGRRGKYR